MTFEILPNDILMFSDGNQVILVTSGIPVSQSRGLSFNFMGRNFSCNNTFTRLDRISSIIGRKIDVMMGLDIIKQFDLIIDFKNRSLDITFADEDSNFGVDFPICHPLSIDSLGYIEIPVKVEGSEFNLIFDTIAKFSYLDPKVTSSFKPSGSEKVYHSTLGYFDTFIYDLSTNIGDIELRTSFGNLPLQIEVLLRMAGIKGVIGSTLLKNFKIGLSISQSKIFLKPYIL